MSPFGLGKMPPNDPTSLGTTILVQKTTTVWNTTAAATARTIALTSVTVGDGMLLGVSIAGAIVDTVVSSVVATVGTTSTPTLIVQENIVTGNRDVEWWYCTVLTTSAGVVTMSITPSASTHFGMWMSELSNGTLGTPPRTPSAGSTNTATSANVGYKANNSPLEGSWVGVLSNVGTGLTETNSVGLGTFDAGATYSGGTCSGLSYGTWGQNTPAATGWTITSGPWVTACIVVAP